MGIILKSIKEKESAFGCCAAFLGSMVVVYFASGRIFFTFSTETDFIARNIMEAQRLLNGEPLLLQFHPPFYSIILASFQIIFRDWFTTGLFLSWISSTIVLVITFLFFYLLWGRFAAWGCLVGLMSSRLFLTYSSFATQDMFFLALYCSCFFLAFLAMEKGSRTLWGITGFVLGCALLTRANSLTLLILLAVPWVQQESLRVRLKDFACILVVCTIVLGTWGVAAKLTGSPFGPRLGHVNLAMRYFHTGGDPFTIEARQQLIEKFSGYKDVFLYDPKHLAVTYVKDMLLYLKRNFLSTELLAFPFLLFALPGIFLLFFMPRNIFALFFLIATISQVALLGFKEYEARFYLFLIPVLAASAGLCLQQIRMAIPGGWKQGAALILFLPFLLVGAKEVKNSLEETYEALHAQDEELGEVIPLARKLVDPDGQIVCRKEHIPFYLGVRHSKLPDVAGLDDLRDWIERSQEKDPIYLYYGSDEKRHRSALADLSFAERAPAWLEPLAQSRDPGKWALYRFQPLLPRGPGNEVPR